MTKPKRKQGRYYVSMIVSHELLEDALAWAHVEPTIAPRLEEQARQLCDKLGTSRTRYRAVPVRAGRSDDMFYAGLIRFFLKFDAVREWVRGG